MYCIKCKQETNSDSIICESCKNKIENTKKEQIIDRKSTDITNDDRINALVTCILSILFTYIIPIVIFFLGKNFKLLYLIYLIIIPIGLYFLIKSKDNYPNSIFTKIIVWLFRITVFIILALIVYLIIRLIMEIAGLVIDKTTTLNE